jgi:hypothetical protein
MHIWWKTQMDEDDKTEGEKRDDKIVEEVMKEIREMECLSFQWK